MKPPYPLNGRPDIHVSITFRQVNPISLFAHALPLASSTTAWTMNAIGGTTSHST